MNKSLFISFVIQKYNPGTNNLNQKYVIVLFEYTDKAMINKLILRLSIADCHGELHVLPEEPLK